MTISLAALDKLEKLLPKSKTSRDESLSRHTYFKLGGPAGLLTTVSSTQELVHAIKSARTLHVPFFILGSGSNILVGDQGIRGLVIKNEARGISHLGTLVTAESGALVTQLVSYANDHGLGGLEVFLSVPGTVGGAVYNNSHYRGGEGELIGNTVVSGEILLNGKTKTVDRDWFNFSYDSSSLQKTDAVLLTVTFQLENTDPAVLTQRSLETLKRRNERQPVGLACSGCTFKNVNGASAGKLIDDVGLKGFRVGGAYVSPVHANFIINDGSATVQDVLELMHRVRRAVVERTGVELVPEIFLVGEFSALPQEFHTSWHRSS